VRVRSIVIRGDLLRRAKQLLPDIGFAAAALAAWWVVEIKADDLAAFDIAATLFDTAVNGASRPGAISGVDVKSVYLAVHTCVNPI